MRVSWEKLFQILKAVGSYQRGLWSARVPEKCSEIKRILTGKGNPYGKRNTRTECSYDSLEQPKMEESLEKP